MAHTFHLVQSLGRSDEVDFFLSKICELLDIDRFLREKNQLHQIFPNFGPNERYGLKQEKSSVRLGCRVHSLALGPFSMCLTVTVSKLCRVCELLDIDRFLRKKINFI